MTSETVHVDLGGRKQIPVHVDLCGDAARARFLATYPGDPQDADSVKRKHIDWFVEVTAHATQFSESDIRSLSMQEMMDFCAEVVPVALDLEKPEPTNVPEDDWMVVQR